MSQELLVNLGLKKNYTFGLVMMLCYTAVLTKMLTDLNVSNKVFLSSSKPSKWETTKLLGVA